MPWKATQTSGTEPLLTREWLVTNGLGGYACGTVAGVCTRRYHGLLIAALPAPLRRMMMLNHLAERVLLADGTSVWLGGREQQGRLTLRNAGALTEFRLENGLPVWTYEIGPIALEKRLFQPHLQNTTHLQYRVVSGAGRVQLSLRPSMNFRPHDASVNAPLARAYALTMIGDRYEVCPGLDMPPLRIRIKGEKSALVLSGGKIRNLHYRIESARGYPDVGDFWSPGFFRVFVSPDEPAILTASIEPWTTILALRPDEALVAEHVRRMRLLQAADRRARSGPAAELVLAADQFVIQPAGRVEDAAWARAAGDEVRTVIAGYHWFTDWGRDTMISLEGLTLTTGRHAEAGYILRTFAHYIRDGLIPNMFPEGKREGLYHTADATLWFFHAIDRYLQATGDRDTLKLLLPKLVKIVKHHLRGTRFGIGVDPADGLLHQGLEGYQLTWMDAKVEDWVVTPRRGKAVEINALWYNALRLLEGWIRDERGEAAARPVAEHADRARAAFNRRFWYEEGAYLYDVIDGENGNDPSCRPNQLFAVSLPNPVLDPRRWERVVDVARERLLTPVGLRSLAPGSPDYKPTYDGDLRSRDAAYHQGTVWAWLVGPYVDALLKVYPDDRSRALAALQGFIPHLGEACIGSISEIFDAREPYTPRGCVAQAWSVAEVLRCWVKAAPELSPVHSNDASPSAQPA
jgi:predicted glycogen debranching enzyme